MAVSERAAALAPYMQRLLDDQKVQGALRRAAGATRGVYGRARGKSARQAAKDRKLRSRLRQAVGAALEAWSAIDQPAPRRKVRWARGLAAVAVVGGAGVFLAVNKQARQGILSLLGKKDADPPNPSNSSREVNDGGDTLS
jgi:CubicO group peptidase (beta-lactamase class C family)